MTESLPPLIAALLEPARYPHPVDRVELMQTHGAWVLLAGAHVYKIKKPVSLPFMDFGTLALRRAACEAELRVNRRFEGPDPATHIYREALPITGEPAAPRLGGEAAAAIEWAVHMRRFPEADRLDHVAARGELTVAMVQRLARELAAFQARAAVAPTASDWGRPEGVMAFARENLDALRGSMTDAADLARVEALGDWTEAQFERLAPLMAQRRAQARVREGHGDLHLANLLRVGDGVQAFDAIEFNDALRWIDVASDIAFTWMDLRRVGAGGLANALLSEWLDASGDVSAPAVLPFLAVYRAMVRAKVAGIRLAQCQAGAGDADNEGAAAAALQEARSYLALADRIARPAAPQLVITHGLSGSGKTWASTRWLGGCRTWDVESENRPQRGQFSPDLPPHSGAMGQKDGEKWTAAVGLQPTIPKSDSLLGAQDAPALRLRSDVERKRLHGLAALQASGSGLNSGLYSPQAHGDTYASLRSRAGELLAQGWSVIVDAAFLRRHEREAFAALAAEAQVPFHILACEAPVEELRRRIAARQAAGGDASEATLAVLEQQLGWLEPLQSPERAQVIGA